MTLLDRFRSQPRQKHPDPAVRLAYVTELPLDEHDLIMASAREDDDPRVRRAAVAKLMDPPALADIVREDGDETVRAQAIAMLRDIALDAFEGVSEAASLAAVEALDDAKALAHIVKASLREEVGRRALGRIADEHVLGSIARHAALESIRQGAFDRLNDRAEIYAVAMNSGTMAMERIPTARLMLLPSFAWHLVGLRPATLRAPGEGASLTPRWWCGSARAVPPATAHGYPPRARRRRSAR